MRKSGMNYNSCLVAVILWSAKENILPVCFLLFWSAKCCSLPCRIKRCDVMFSDLVHCILTVHRSTKHRIAESGKQLVCSLMFMGFCKIVCQKGPYSRKDAQIEGFEHTSCRNEVIVSIWSFTESRILCYTSWPQSGKGRKRV